MTSNKISSKKVIFSFLIIFSVVILDQLTKVWVIKSGIAHACNTGFAFGILQGILNGLIAFLALLGVIYIFTRQARLDHQPSFYSSSERKRVEKFPLSSSRMLGLALIIAGGASNIVDRLIRGCVVDFIRWPSQTWLLLPDWLQSSLTRWPAFNLADMAISVGVGILVLSLIRNSRV